MHFRDAVPELGWQWVLSGPDFHMENKVNASCTQNISRVTSRFSFLLELCGRVC